MRELCPDIEITNFCYPFGVVSLPRKLQLQKHFDTCRGIFEGVNAGTIDLGLLKVIELYDRTLSRDKLRHVLRSAHDRNGWVIFYAHDVTQPPSLMGGSSAERGLPLSSTGASRDRVRVKAQTKFRRRPIERIVMSIQRE
jgi:hypothetical protein